MALFSRDSRLLTTVIVSQALALQSCSSSQKGNVKTSSSATQAESTNSDNLEGIRQAYNDAGRPIPDGVDTDTASSETGDTAATDDPTGPNPEEEVDPANDPNDPAVLAFAQTMGPIIEANCVGCHGGGTAPDMPSQDSTTQRNSLLAFAMVETNDLYAKVRNVVAHDGGDLSAALSKDAVDAWLTSENITPPILGLTAYREKMKTAVDMTCAGAACHGGGAGGMTLTANGDTANRDALTARAANYNTICDKILANGQAHNGGMDAQMVLMAADCLLWLNVDVNNMP